MAIWAKQNILQYAAVCILKDQHNVCKKTHTHTLGTGTFTGFNGDLCHGKRDLLVL